MGVGGKAGDQRGSSARWGTSPQTGGVEQMNHLWRAGWEGYGCRGEGSRLLVGVVLHRSRDKQGTQTGSWRRWQETNGPVVGAMTALASVA